MRRRRLPAVAAAIARRGPGRLQTRARARACPTDLAGQAPGPAEGSALEREGEVAGVLATQPDCRNEFPSLISLSISARKRPQPSAISRTGRTGIRAARRTETSITSRSKRSDPPVSRRQALSQSRVKPLRHCTTEPWSSSAVRPASLPCSRSSTSGRVEPHIHPLQDRGLRRVPAGGAEHEEPGVEELVVCGDAKITACLEALGRARVGTVEYERQAGGHDSSVFEHRSTPVSVRSPQQERIAAHMCDARRISAREVSQGVQRRVLD